MEIEAGSICGSIWMQSSSQVQMWYQVGVNLVQFHVCLGMHWRHQKRNWARIKNNSFNLPSDCFVCPGCYLTQLAIWKHFKARKMKKKQQLVEKSAGETSYSSVLPEPEVMSYKWKTVIPQSQDRLYDTEWTRNSWSMRSLFYPKQKTKDRHGNVILRYLHTPFSLIYWKLRITF